MFVPLCPDRLFHAGTCVAELRSNTKATLAAPAFLKFHKLLTERAHELCTIQAIAPHQSQVINRLARTIELCLDIWDAFLAAVLELVPDAVARGPETEAAQRVQEAVEEVQNNRWRLDDATAEVAMANIDALVTMRELFGEMMKKFRNFFGGYLFKDLGLSPDGQLRQKQAIRAELMTLTAPGGQGSSTSKEQAAGVATPTPAPPPAIQGQAAAPAGSEASTGTSGTSRLGSEADGEGPEEEEEDEEQGGEDEQEKEARPEPDPDLYGVHAPQPRATGAARRAGQAGHRLR